MSAISIPADINRKLLEMARQQIMQGNLKKAAQALNKAHRQAPHDARVFMLGGLLADKANNPAKAEESFQRCLEMAPMWGPGLLEYAMYSARSGETDRAIELAEKVARIEPRNPQVLAAVVDLAHAVGNLDMAIHHLRRGLELHPGDAVLRRYLAVDLSITQQHAEATMLWDTLVLERPDEAELRYGRIKACAARGEPAAAMPDILVLREKFPEDPTLDYYATLARGEVPSRQPVEVHQSMFNKMAGQFDQHLVRGLQYQLPKLVADQLIEQRPDKDFNLLDLGCGTGLLGACLGPMKGYLIGVDSSLAMIEQAAQHNVYDRFHHVDLLKALRDTPEEQYEVLTSLDVLIYVGDLQPVIPNAARILKAGGSFIFSCEAAPEDGPDLLLQGSHRYAHKLSHVEELCRQAGLVPSKQELVLRMEAGTPVQGFLITANKPA